MTQIKWRDGTIPDCPYQVLNKFDDARGWLLEMYRLDDLPLQTAQRPEMGYVSMTKPGVMRGPHEHKDQTDLFVFNGSFQVFLWDARPHSKTYGIRQLIQTHERDYAQLIVPPGVVHGYRNISAAAEGVVFNFPNRLYKGWHRADPIDEIRHEDDPESQYVPWE